MNHDRLDPTSAADWERHLGRSVDPARLGRDLSRGMLSSLATGSARRVPDREAVRVGERALTHGQLDVRARRVMAWLAERGMGPGRPCSWLGGRR